MSFSVAFPWIVSLEMATLTPTEPVICPNAIAEAESIVPACMFAPDRGCVDDPCGAEGFEGCDGTNGESADHLDLSSKVGPLYQFRHFSTRTLCFQANTCFYMYKYCDSTYVSV